jgi:hypothetical protein
MDEHPEKKSRIGNYLILLFVIVCAAVILYQIYENVAGELSVLIPLLLM